jgi:UDP-glucose 4-epimerase
VVEANRLAAAAAGPFRGTVLNVACGERLSLNDLVGRLNRILGTALTPVYEPPRPGDVKHSLADISRARDGLGYAPVVDLDDGLRRTAAWLRNGNAPA